MLQGSAELPSPFLKIISLFWKSSSDMMSGFSQFSHSGLLADDMIRHSSNLPKIDIYIFFSLVITHPNRHMRLNAHTHTHK